MKNIVNETMTNMLQTEHSQKDFEVNKVSKKNENKINNKKLKGGKYENAFHILVNNR